MRKEYLRALHRLFGDAARLALPAFSKQKPRKPYYSSNELVYQFDSEDGCAYLVVVSPHMNGHEAFTVEIGWSVHGTQPALSMRPSPGDPLLAHPNREEEFITRLAYVDPSAAEFWYIDPIPASDDDMLRQIVESTKPLADADAELRVRQVMTQALSGIERIGLPFLRQRGLSS